MSVLVDRYELGERLGSGGMATVVEGHDRVLDRPVAIKLLGRYEQPDARARLLREARAAARLHHPAVVAVYDTGEHDGRPFIVMELVHGRSLADELHERGSLDIEEAVAITLGILDALAVAHAAGILHRDVKPANVLLPTAGGVKLTDFGIAKALEDASAALTVTGTVLGTPNYLAPERVHGGTASPASDVYSVGCVLFQLLTGRPPYTGESAVSIAYAHVHQPVPDVGEVRTDVPRDLAAVVTNAMRKDPGERYADAIAMRSALLEGPNASPTRTAVLPPPTEAAPTQPVAASGSVRAHPHGTPARQPTRWPLIALVVLAALAGLWLLADTVGVFEDGQPDPDDAVQGAAPGDGEEQPGDDATQPSPDATSDDPDDAAADEPVDPAPTDPPADDEAPTDDEPDGGVEDDPATDAPEGETPAEPQTLDELIAFLAASPTGTYGEKHGDLLEDLIELRDDQAPGQRATEAGALREEVEDYVADGELDAEVGRLALAILDEVASQTGT